MIVVEYFEPHESGPGNEFVGQIVLQPNNSMSWQATRYFLVTLMLISFTMASLFLIRGYWMILPFSIIEMSVLGGCFYYIVRRAQFQQVLFFGAEQVVVEYGRKSPERRVVWPRFFTKVMVQPPKHPWYPIQISLRCKNQEEEIGQFLTAEEKKQLVSELRRMIVVADRSRFSSAAD
jgi:uncharacterized membrane protein